MIPVLFSLGETQVVKIQNYHNRLLHTVALPVFFRCDIFGDCRCIQIFLVVVSCCLFCSTFLPNNLYWSQGSRGSESVRLFLLRNITICRSPQMDLPEMKHGNDHLTCVKRSWRKTNLKIEFGQFPPPWISIWAYHLRHLILGHFFVGQVPTWLWISTRPEGHRALRSPPEAVGYHHVSRLFLGYIHGYPITNHHLYYPVLFMMVTKRVIMSKKLGFIRIWFTYYTLLGLYATLIWGQKWCIRQTWNPLIIFLIKLQVRSIFGHRHHHAFGGYIIMWKPGSQMHTCNTVSYEHIVNIYIDRYYRIHIYRT